MRPDPHEVQVDAAGSQIPVATHLTCEAAIAAARVAITSQVPTAAIAYLEFHFGRHCPPGSFCGIASPDLGYVIAHARGLGPDLLVNLSADDHGIVSVSLVEPLAAAS